MCGCIEVSGAGTLVNQDELHSMAMNEDVEERRKAIELLYSKFAYLSDKNQAWEDLHKLTQDKDRMMRWNATGALGIAFRYIPNKEQAWEDLYRLSQDKSSYVRMSASVSLGLAFTYIPDKKQAWECLHKLAQDKNKKVRQGAAYSLGATFSIIPDRELAYKDLHRLTQDKDNNVRQDAGYSLCFAFSYIPDKKQAWQDLIQLLNDKEIDELWAIAHSLEAVFPHLPDKEQAWQNLHRLTQSKESRVRWGATHALQAAFPYVSDKKQAWEDLNRLLQDKDDTVREEAVYALGTIFTNVPDKKQAWEVLHKLIYDTNKGVQKSVGTSLGQAFSQIHDKKQAWEDIHYLTYNEDHVIRWSATRALGSIIPYISNNEQVWKDLHRLTQDDNSMVRWGSASIIGSAFLHIHDKKQAWSDLNRLTQDKDSDVKASANHSLGKASIFNAITADNEENFKKELENALNFFKKSLMYEVDFDNPAKFCLPFYKSFYTIIFKREEAEAEVHEYLTEARSTLESLEIKEKLLERGWETKEKLLVVIENLADAIREIQKTWELRKIQETEAEVIKCDFNAYKPYLKRATDLLYEMEKTTPGATKLIQRGLPIIDQKIKEIIAEIQENAKTLCKQTRDTPLEDLGKEVNRVSQNFPQIRDPIGLEKGFINLWTALSSICAKMPEEERGEACELLKKTNDEPYIEDKLPLINMVLSKISSQISAAKNIETVEKKLDEIMVSLKPGIREELVISVGAEFAGTGAQHVITVPIQDISYPDLKNDLEKINGKGVLKLSSLPAKLAEKIKSYLV